MYGTYAALFHSMFIERRPLDHLGFQGVVDLANKLESQGLKIVNKTYFGFYVVGLTLRIVVGGMQWVRRSYSRARTCNNRAGDRSAKISWAVRAIKASQSGGGIGVLSVTFSLEIYIS